MERNADGIALRPAVGLGVYILNYENKVLLGKRKAKPGLGEFATPGGHLEFGETFEEACKKEVKEETDLDISNIQLFNIDNNLRYLHSDQKHYVTLSFKTEYAGGNPKLMEPEKCEGWEWYALHNLPSPLAEFTEVSLQKLITQNGVIS